MLPVRYDQCDLLLYQSTIRCTKEGVWTDEFTMCRRIEGSCSTPPDLNSVEYSCDEGLDVGKGPKTLSHISADYRSSIYGDY